MNLVTVRMILVLSRFLSSAEKFTLTILHTGRIDGRFEPQNGKYGVARAIQFIKDEKSKLEGHVLYFETMDCFFGGLFFDIYRWKICADFMNLMPSDAHSLGESEMNDGPKTIRERNLRDFLLAITTKTVLCCNCEAEKDPDYRTHIKRSKILEIAGRKVGVTAYIANDIVSSWKIGEMTFSDDVTAIRREVANLKRDGVSIVILLAHDRKFRTVDVVRSIEDVDVVVGGHTVAFYFNGKPPTGAVNLMGDYPAVLKDAKGRNVLEVRAGVHLLYVGRLQVSFDETGEAVDWSGNCVHMSEDIKEDPVARKTLDKLAARVRAEEKKVIGKTLVPLPLLCQWRECNLGNFIVDAFVMYRLKHLTEKEKRWTDVAIGIMNSGALRKGIPFGSNTTKSIRDLDATQILPWMNYVRILQMNGSVLREALEYGASSNVEEKNDRFLQVSGIKVVYDMSAKPGKRIESLRVRCRDCETPRYENVVVKRLYWVILPDYIALGGDGFAMLRNAAKTYDWLYETDTAVFKDYIKDVKNIQIGEEERIIIKNCPKCFDTEQ